VATVKHCSEMTTRLDVSNAKNTKQGLMGQQCWCVGARSVHLCFEHALLQERVELLLLDLSNCSSCNLLLSKCSR
jgi:hypothetical protein